MGNPFNDSLDTHFLTEEVVAYKDGVRYQGWVKVFDYGSGSVSLLDATRDGERVGAAVVREPDVVHRVDPDIVIREVNPATIAATPYSVREFNSPGFHEYVREVREQGGPGSYPLVREHGGGFQVVDGNKRVAASQAAGLSEIPVRVADISEWEATVRWVDAHIAIPGLEDSNRGRNQRWYSDDMVRDALRTLRDRWSDTRLQELPQLRPYIGHADQPDEPATIQE